jgi:hypothetical protein
LPIPEAALSKAWVCDRSLAMIMSSNSVDVIDVSLVSVVCCQVEVFVTGRSFVQGIPLIVLFLIVIEKTLRGGGLGPLGLLSHEKRKRSNVTGVP